MPPHSAFNFVVIIAATLGYYPELHAQKSTVTAETPWPRYAIDDTLRGADGVRLADADGDGRLDITTGWEESGNTRIYLHPGQKEVFKPWPAQTVGNAPSVEDSVWVDLDRDGRLDVLASCEGKEQSLRVFFAPTDSLLQSEWESHTIPASKSLTRWMYCEPVPTAQSPEYIVVGSKNPRGMVGIMRFGQARDVDSFKIMKLCDAGWIMSIVSLDVDRDGDLDILFTDRKGTQSGAYWLENPGKANLHSPRHWHKHLIGGLGREVMFAQIIERLNESSGKKRYEVVVAAKTHDILWMREGDDCRQRWSTEKITIKDMHRIGRAKCAVAGDIDQDGQLELVVTCESATPPLSGVAILKKQTDGSWSLQGISGPEGIKYDLIELIDLDDDGDLDVLTCEERHNGRGLGVIWYANPLY